MTAERSRRGLGFNSKTSFAYRGDRMNAQIEYATISEQIEKLRQQGLVIEDEGFASSELELYGYTNLIKGYRDPYTFIEEGKRKYRSGVTFEQVWSLYILDKNLRNAIIASMLDLEECVKEKAADTIAKTFGVDQKQYLQFRNFNNIKKHKEQFTLKGILTSFGEKISANKAPISHYMQKYGIVPPWILFKSVYFSTIVNFVALFKQNEQYAVASKLYNEKLINILPPRDLRFLMMDTLYICLEYRNLAAHGGRIYDHICKSALRQNYGQSITGQGVGQLIHLLYLLNYSSPYQHLHNALNTQLTRHCSRYPQDITYLGQILNINIIQRNVVWVPTNSIKYHKDRFCSGIKNSVEMDLDEAQKRGFKPCKKCCQQE